MCLDMEGMKVNLITSSSGANWSSVTGTAQKEQPLQNNAVCECCIGWLWLMFAMEDSCSISETHSATFFSMKLFTNASLPIGVPRYLVPAVVTNTSDSEKIVVAFSRCVGFVQPCSSVH